MKEDKKILIITMLSGIFVWVVDAVIDYLLYKGSFAGVLILDVPPEKIAARLSLLIYFLTMYLMLSWFFSKKRRAEKKMAFFEQQYRRLFGSTKDGIIQLSAETGEVLEVNPFFEELLGYTAAELKGKMIWEISHLREVAADSADLEDLRRKKRIRYYDLPLKTKKGRDIVVELVSNVYTVDKKEVIQYNLRDVTARRAAEERLLLLSEIIEQSGDGIAACDMDGIIMFINKAFARVHGYESEELIGKHLSLFHTPEQMFAVDEANRKIKKTGEFSGEIWHVRKDGTAFPAWMHNTLLRDELGRPIGIIGTIQDITERKYVGDVLGENRGEFAA